MTFLRLEVQGEEMAQLAKSGFGTPIRKRDSPTERVKPTELMTASALASSEKSSETEIGLLIGADNIGKLLTGNLIEFDLGLTAIETKLGWTVIGKIVDKECEPLYSPTEIDKEIEAVEQYFDKIVTWRFRAKKQLGKNNKFKSDSDSCKTTEESKLIEPMKVKLPKLIIPKFYGEINQWLSFWNSFKTAIHDNNSLNSIDKFTYLKGLFGSSALATVEGFAITAENYAKAVEILKDRFGRKDAIINSHMQKLLSVTRLKRSDDTKVLRQFFDMCQTQIRSLESLDVSFESFSNVLCPLILNCLPSDLVLEFNKETDGSEYKLDELLKFLNKQISARERTESSISTQYIPHSQRIQPSFNRFKSENYKHNSQKINSSFRKQPFPAPTAANFMASSNEKNANESCLFCKHESHQTAICPWAKQKKL
ncbi:uncharacterized protein TNCV_505101 [Trichonephila clavipes]|nr:uncharacterized protein TNCV_505101 [Trichonephila clavipes]